MTYEYNSKAHYAPYGKYRELITGKDLTQLYIIAQEDLAVSKLNYPTPCLISMFTNISSKEILCNGFGLFNLVIIS